MFPINLEKDEGYVELQRKQQIEYNGFAMTLTKGKRGKYILSVTKDNVTKIYKRREKLVDTLEEKGCTTTRIRLGHVLPKLTDQDKTTIGFPTVVILFCYKKTNEPMRYFGEFAGRNKLFVAKKRKRHVDPITEKCDNAIKRRKHEDIYSINLNILENPMGILQ